MTRFLSVYFVQMVKEKVSFLCGNIKKNILRRGGTTENSAPSSPAITRSFPSNSSFDKNSRGQLNSSESREEILCIFDKSLNFQHDSDEISTSFEIPPEPPPRIYFPPVKSPNLTRTRTSHERIESGQFVHVQIETNPNRNDNRTPSEHSRSTASEIFSPQAPSISSHSSNSSTESFHCDGCHCSQRSSQHIAMCGSHFKTRAMTYSGNDNYSKTTSNSSHQSVSIGSSDSLHTSSFAEHNYSMTHHKRESSGNEVIIPPRMKPSALASGKSEFNNRRTSGVVIHRVHNSQSPQPPPFLPPKNFMPSSSSSGKKCECTNCKIAYGTSTSSSSSNHSIQNQTCESVALSRSKEENSMTHMEPCAPKKSSRLCERKTQKDCPEYENHLENSNVSESSWPEIGEVVPTVSAFYQSKKCKRRSSFSKSFDKVEMSLKVHDDFRPIDVELHPKPIAFDPTYTANTRKLNKLSILSGKTRKFCLT